MSSPQKPLQKQIIYSPFKSSKQKPEPKQLRRAADLISDLSKPFAKSIEPCNTSSSNVETETTFFVPIKNQTLLDFSSYKKRKLTDTVNIGISIGSVCCPRHCTFEYSINGLFVIYLIDIFDRCKKIT